MNITLKQADIEAAIRQFVGNSGVTANGRELSAIKFSTTRNPVTVFAELSLDAHGAAATGDVPGFTDRPAETKADVKEAVVAQAKIDAATEATLGETKVDHKVGHHHAVSQGDKSVGQSARENLAHAKVEANEKETPVADPKVKEEVITSQVPVAEETPVEAPKATTHSIFDK